MRELLLIAVMALVFALGYRWIVRLGKELERNKISAAAKRMQVKTDPGESVWQTREARDRMPYQVQIQRAKAGKFEEKMVLRTRLDQELEAKGNETCYNEENDSKECECDERFKP